MKTGDNLADILNNMPQKQLAHKFLTASATVDGINVNMLEDNGSPNALAPLTFLRPVITAFGCTVSSASP